LCDLLSPLTLLSLDWNPKPVLRFDHESLRTYADFRSLVGKVIDVLIDGVSEDGQLIGRTQWDAPDIDPVVFIGPPEDDSVPMPKVFSFRLRHHSISVLKACIAALGTRTKPSLSHPSHHFLRFFRSGKCASATSTMSPLPIWMPTSSRDTAFVSLPFVP
jgi:hypothetical protein